MDKEGIVHSIAEGDRELRREPERAGISKYVLEVVGGSQRLSMRWWERGVFEIPGAFRNTAV